MAVLVQEFIGATMHVSKLQQEHHLVAAFKVGQAEDLSVVQPALAMLGINSTSYYSAHS